MANNDFATVKEQAHIKEYADAKLEKVHGGYKCPHCKSGTGPNKTPALSFKGEFCKCFSCGFQGDVFDLAGAVIGNTDKKAELKEVAAFFNVNIEHEKHPLDWDSTITFTTTPKWIEKKQRSKEKAAPGPTTPQQASKEEKGSSLQVEEDHTEHITAERDYLKRCRENIADSEGMRYVLSRGFTQDEVISLGIGYDPVKRRVTLPWIGCDYYHIDRDITDTNPVKYLKPKSENVGKQPFFNEDALKEDAFFIVEGVLDAYAVQVCGYEAVALGSNRNSDVIARITAAGYKGECLIMLDNDDKGCEGAGELSDQLKEAGVFCSICTINAKDPAEYLQRDRDGLKQELHTKYECSLSLLSQIEEVKFLQAMKQKNVLDPTEAASRVITLEGIGDYVSTGFKNIDDAIDGGLKPGVTALGAVSSFGKTTLCVHWADNIAASGRTVLFVTIEQSAAEIASKTLSRFTREIGGIPWGVISTSQMLSAKKRAHWGEDRTSLLLEACARYSAEIAPYLRIMECQNQPSVIEIRRVVESMTQHNSEPPVVFIDYLQLLAAQNEHDTDKQAIDKNMMSLRQLARDFQTPVVVISSLNRSSYSGSIELDSFKESGAIEYCSDLILGLQPRGMTEDLEDVAERNQKRKANKIMRANKTSLERECELRVLKARNSSIPAEGVPLTFIPVSSLYIEPNEDDDIITI